MERGVEGGGEEREVWVEVGRGGEVKRGYSENYIFLLLPE